MSIRLTTAKGHPVVIRRPDLIVSMAGYQRQDPETGEVRDHTAITFENREVVFVAGHADVIEAAIEEHQSVRLRDFLHRRPLWADPVKDQPELQPVAVEGSV